MINSLSPRSLSIILLTFANFCLKAISSWLSWYSLRFLLKFCWYLCCFVSSIHDKGFFSSTTKHPFVYLFFFSFFRKNIISLSYFIFFVKNHPICFLIFIRVLHFLFFLKRKNFKISKYKSAYSQVQLSGLISIAKWTTSSKTQNSARLPKRNTFLVDLCFVLFLILVFFLSLQRKKQEFKHWQHESPNSSLKTHSAKPFNSFPA